ncbi:MAG: VWA-like domain-containing protein [Lamprobacter sp.]|uniref:vWA domain-containing protein n=1 Tax=Lamprobacter sp. TaxID=3100796 RepID=UPI002B260782|nr:VWA-like domain-containing protein [Lamprobacter sp.]MEA3638443.1 VWA-like domain-containing protein [Lamprobacter sp.]
MQASLHTHRGTRAIQKLVEYAPSTGGLALWIRHQDVDALPVGAEHDPGMPIGVKTASLLSAANDGRTIFYTPAFAALSLPLQIGQVAHQVLHVALQHAQRARALERLLGEVDLGLFNICADAIVNSTLSHLAWLELPSTAVSLEGLLASTLNCQQSPAAALLEWDLERLYRAIDDRRPRLLLGRGDQHRATPRRDGKRGQRRGCDGRDAEHQTPGPDQQARPQSVQPADRNASREDGARASRVRWLGADTPRDLLPANEASRPEQEAEQAREWRERLIRAHAGDGAHSMLRELIADLPKLRTPWEHLLRTLLTRGLARTPDQSWSRPSRSYLANQGRTPGGQRLPWEPGRTASRAVPRLVVMVDLSGSIDPPLLERFAREIEAISRRLEASLTLIAGDDRVSGVAQFEPGGSNLRELVFDGGGGTDFSPLLREAERYAPDIAVFLTDLDGPAEYKPSYPVIWAVPAIHANARQPFGRKLVLE